MLDVKKEFEKAQEFTKTDKGPSFAQEPPKKVAPGTAPRSQYSEVRDARKQ